MQRETYITLYNRIFDEDTEQVYFLKTPPLFVHLEPAERKGGSGSNQSDKDAYSIWIPKICEMEIGRSYVTPHDFAKMPTTEKVKHFTLATEDVICVGKLNENIHPGKYEQFIIGHPDALLIKNVEANLFGSPALRHWEILCED